VAVKFADEDPAGTITEAGTLSIALLLESDTVAPPAEAGCAKVTVQVEVLAELRMAGLHATLWRPLGKTTDRVTGTVSGLLAAPYAVRITDPVYVPGGGYPEPGPTMGEGFSPTSRVPGVMPASWGPANSQLPPSCVVVDTLYVKGAPLDVISKIWIGGRVPTT
jgi:hypothetical protein